MQEAEIIDTKEIIKPEFKNEIKAEITGISKIEDNIQEVKDYALKLSEYYGQKQFDEGTTKEVKKEMAEVNKFKEKVNRFRIDIEKKWNEPLNKFILEAKETEVILKETYNNLNNQVSTYEEKRKQEKEQEIKSYFYEYCESKNINFVEYEKANIKVTLSTTMKSLKEQAKSFVDKIVDDISLINSQQYIDEIMIEYKKDLNVLRAITDINIRHIELEKIKNEKETKEKQLLTDEVMLNKIESLSAPKVEKVEPKEELVTFAFEFTGSRESAKIIVDTLKSIECQYRQLKKVEDRYE